jgi:hypothetical protein
MTKISLGIWCHFSCWNSLGYAFGWLMALVLICLCFTFSVLLFFLLFINNNHLLNFLYTPVWRILASLGHGSYFVEIKYHHRTMSNREMNWFKMHIFIWLYLLKKSLLLQTPSHVRITMLLHIFIYVSIWFLNHLRCSFYYFFLLS